MDEDRLKLCIIDILQTWFISENGAIDGAVDEIIELLRQED